MKVGLLSWGNFEFLSKAQSVFDGYAQTYLSRLQGNFRRRTERQTHRLKPAFQCRYPRQKGLQHARIFRSFSTQNCDRIHRHIQSVYADNRYIAPLLPKSKAFLILLTFFPVRLYQVVPSKKLALLKQI